MAGAHALRDAVRVDRQAVGDVLGAQRNLHQIVLVDLDPGRIEREPADADRKRLRGRTLVLSGGGGCSEADAQKNVPDREALRHGRLIVRRSSRPSGRRVWRLAVLLREADTASADPHVPGFSCRVTDFFAD
jgi:hypothetical protein